MRYQLLSRYSDVDFKRLAGVHRSLFQEMVQVLEESEDQKKKSGRPHTLSIEDQLLLTLNYLCHYSTQLELSASYAISESNINRTIQKVENALMISRKFTLPKREQREVEDRFNWVIIDTTETPIERPKKTYSGKKKRHTLKTQIIYHPHSRQILGGYIARGCIHDINLARKTIKDLYYYRYVLADLGYYGLKA